MKQYSSTYFSVSIAVSTFSTKGCLYKLVAWLSKGL